MHIHQMSARHDQEQDRILVSLNTTDDEELRFWLTRRLMDRLWPTLNTLVIEHFAVPEDAQTDGYVNLDALDDDSKAMLAHAQQEASLQSADFQTPYKSGGLRQPLGQQPLLVTKIDLTIGKSRQLRFRVTEALQDSAEPREFQMELKPELTFGLMQLLKQAIARADWGIALTGVSASATDDASAIFARAEPSNYLN